MDRNKIITDLWNSKDVNDAFSKMHPVELQSDLKAEVFAVLCELPDDKLFGMHERGEIRFFLVRVMLNMIKSDRSGFWKKYRNHVEYKFDEVAVAENYSEELFEKIDNCISSMHWYQKEILRLYAIDFNKNAKELSRNTGIPYMSIIRTLKQTKTELKKKIRK